MAASLWFGSSWPAQARSIAKGAVRTVGHGLAPLHLARGRLSYLLPFPRRFTGAYPSYDAAMAAARRRTLAGYDHDEIATVAFGKMCEVAPWDYPVLFWIRNLLPSIDGLVDAGGHMGTKYRAFRSLLPLGVSFQWVVYDLPAIVRAGQSLAEKEGLAHLKFVDRIEDAGRMPLFLGSGLMQYLDMPLSRLLQQMPSLPQHLILNKVALRKGDNIVTLERIGRSYVPYHMRNEADFIADITRLGYKQIDRWTIPSLSHTIDTHPEMGRSESAGFYFQLG
ncbi:methyltransferase, TIGR04325 family [Rhizobium lusitanum]|uniref:Putative methyltransferase (TIGR04325 family) n=1 Tax=Rhizobium lusitanum TaxID=293958 RepID=A0A7X0MCV4_9HYPH|nr:methyltransferase, TIGR04325 family [Rhizobium lusitanum]MBB6486247.1 putative methyltransferase (TIGR04325 family) [Rhizobium lusitanum]